jgi:hypothetical protein
MVCEVESCLGEAALEKNFDAFDVTKFRCEITSVAEAGGGRGTHLKWIGLTGNYTPQGSKKQE